MHLLPGRPSQDGATWWLLVPPGAQPELGLDGGAGPPRALRLEQIVVDGRNEADVYVASATGLVPDQRYTLRVRAGDGKARAASRTLPDALRPGRPFTVALGSCYCFATHQGLRHWFPPLAFGEADPVRLNLLCGDQIYMDLSPDDGTVLLGEPDPFARYLQQWRSPHFHRFAARSPSLFLADDHEYWNNYPHKPAWLPWAEDRPGGPLGARLDRAFSVFQAAPNLDPAAVAAGDAAAVDSLLTAQARSFRMDVDPISFFLLDSRTARTRVDDSHRHFASPQALSEAIQWLGNLSGPGFLVIAQPIFTKPSTPAKAALDASLPDYKEDFQALCDAIFSAPHDVLILSGDIHWSRIYHARRPSGGPDVFEIVSSPLSRIPKLPFESLLTANRGEERGTFRWGGDGRSARWRRKAVVSGANATYTTISIQRTEAASSACDVEVIAWGWDWDIRHAKPIARDTIQVD